MAGSLKSYLADPFLNSMMYEIKRAGAMKSSLLDITHKCNLRCVGCYYFVEKMDEHKKEKDDTKFQEFVQREIDRGTNMFTVVGGEPALELDRLRILAKHFKLIVVTNGSIPIPMEGLENIRIAISFWGDEQQDIKLRGNGKKKILDKALEIYKDDPRAGFYYTTLPGYTDGIAQVAERIVANGNLLTFNFYGDLTDLGGGYSHSNGFQDAIDEIEKLVKKYPSQILTSPYINKTISTRHLLGVKWGYDVCSSVTYDHPENLERMQTGKKYPSKFRAYNADLTTTRRCCVGNARDCDTCTDLWATYGWVVGSMKEHLRSKEDFTNWLCTTFIFYLQTGFLDYQEFGKYLPKIYETLKTTVNFEGPAEESQPNTSEATLA